MKSNLRCVQAKHALNPGQTTRVRSGPRGGPHSLYKANGSRQRKRSIPHRSACPPTKRQKPYEHASSAAQTDGEDGSVSGAEGESDGSLEDERATVQEAISVSRLWVDYYRPALKILGQLACKEIAKAWIKSCCEKKQTTNPYNGGDTKDLSMQLHGYEGALTAPVWWPRQGGWEHGEGCRHKEPDHILKPGL